jgi:catechol 2,3-dioxygenase-like lactoylglutathione lyase family enzyme
VVSIATLASAQEVKRPPIVGVAHIALKVKDLKASLNFYATYLGFEAPFEAESGDRLKVNDHQYIELYSGLTSDAEDRLMHVAFETTDARKLRDYLASRGVAAPEKLNLDEDGNLTLKTRDPEGREVWFVQYMAGSSHRSTFGKALPASRISNRIIHVGYIVKDQEAENKFFRDILGFQEFWHGGRTDDRTDWVDMRVPDGKDWLEYMLNQPNPSAKSRGVMNHMALGVPSVDAGYKALQGRGMPIADPPKIGRDGKWQLNLYDPDLTRTELMEPKPVQTPCCSEMKQ